MAYLNQHQYDYRRESAARRAAENSDIGQQNGMTEREAEFITELCSLRHEMHSNIRSYIQSSADISDEMIKLRDSINDTSLPRLDYGRFNDSEFIDIDTIDLLYEIDDVPEDDQERKEWYTENYERIYSDWEELNDIIERYLAEIDNKYKTSFAPTGKLRVF